MIVFTILITTFASIAFAMPTLNCRGDLPAWTIRNKVAIGLNETTDKFQINSRVDADLILGVHADEPWVTIHVTNPLTWTLAPQNYDKFLVLNLKSDPTSSIGIEATGIFSRFAQSLKCVLDDDVRQAGAL